MSGFDFGRGPIQCSVWWDSMTGEGFWVRVFGVGFHGTNAPPPFSVRIGARRSFTVGRWRFKILREP